MPQKPTGDAGLPAESKSVARSNIFKRDTFMHLDADFEEMVFCGQKFLAVCEASTGEVFS